MEFTNSFIDFAKSCFHLRLNTPSLDEQKIPELPLPELPLDVINLIIGFGDPKENVAHYALTSKAFRKLTYGYFGYTRLFQAISENAFQVENSAMIPTEKALTFFDEHPNLYFEYSQELADLIKNNHFTYANSTGKYHLLFNKEEILIVEIKSKSLKILNHSDLKLEGTIQTAFIEEDKIILVLASLKSNAICLFDLNKKDSVKLIVKRPNLDVRNIQFFNNHLFYKTVNLYSSDHFFFYNINTKQEIKFKPLIKSYSHDDSIKDFFPCSFTSFGDTLSLFDRRKASLLEFNCASDTLALKNFTWIENNLPKDVRGAWYLEKKYQHLYVFQNYGFRTPVTNWLFNHDWSIKHKLGKHFTCDERHIALGGDLYLMTPRLANKALKIALSENEILLSSKLGQNKLTILTQSFDESKNLQITIKNLIPLTEQYEDKHFPK